MRQLLILGSAGLALVLIATLLHSPNSSTGAFISSPRVCFDTQQWVESTLKQTLTSFAYNLNADLSQYELVGRLLTTAAGRDANIPEAIEHVKPLMQAALSADPGLLHFEVISADTHWAFPGGYLPVEDVHARYLTNAAKDRTAALRLLNGFWHGPQIDALGDVEFSYMQSIEKDGVLIAAIATAVDVSHLEDHIAKAPKLTKSTSIFAIDNEGRVILGRAAADAIQWSAPARFERALAYASAGRSDAFVWQQDEVERVVVTAPVKSTGWIIVMAVPVEELSLISPAELQPTMAGILQV